MANFNYNDPRYQRDIQRAQAKGNATGNRAKTEPISSRHAGYQLGRQEQFKGLALQKGMKDTQHKMNLARLKQVDRRHGLQNERFNLFKRATNDRLDQAEDNMDWTIGLGLGQLGYGALEGQRRKKVLEADLAQKNKFMMQMDAMIDSQGEEELYRSKGTYGPY